MLEGKDVGKNLRSHKYSREGSSLLEPYFNPYWEFVIDHIPNNIAPNTLTLLGLITNILPVIGMISASPNMDQNVPCWLLFATAMGLFIYQTLDAVDGKQARKLKCSNPLGEFFDHGCDAAASCMLIVTNGCVFKITFGHGLFLFYVMQNFLQFYMFQWQTFVTGKMFFTLMNVTEAQIILIFMTVMPLFVGHDYLNQQVYLGDLFTTPPIWQCIVYVYTIFTIIHTYQLLQRIMYTGAGKNGSSVANSSVLSPAIPAFILLFFSYYITSNHPSLLTTSLSAFVLLFGLSFAKLSTRILLASIVRKSPTLMDSSLVAPFILFLISWYHGESPSPSAVWFCVTIATVDFVKYFADSSLKLAKLLDVPIFTVPSHCPGVETRKRK